MTADAKRRVLVVDDSALVRQVLSAILARHPLLEVVGTARDPYDAREKIKQLSPDVLTLDVEMPRMDGLTFLGKLMRAHPLPVVMLSSLTDKGTATALDALDLGAVDVIGKPALDQAVGLEAMGAEIAETVHAASFARIHRAAPALPSPAFSAPTAAMAPLATRARAGRSLIAVGSSTGGTEALRRIFETIPGNLPPIAVVQHMLPGFTPAFADRLDRASAATVKVAEDGESLQSGTVYLAPSDQHFTAVRRGAGLAVQLREGERVSRHLPSVDVLFESVAEACGPHALGIILTGMGEDGARGLLRMRQRGARTLGQDEATCVVYGMPRVAWARGAVMEQCPLPLVPHLIAEWCERQP
ncbi:chemotaxis response regulator protein-glutamate methylesterase of group 1 operon [Geothrix oryzae]|uniref:Protein-glutamate methylesterase/protein-glutamine glutaminase n=1 Tax=Geothrix oryzae TaxID=2927975 RepID=A0ABM8DS27_9BACT|nr:chemotaxis response regulator protein-glutamate methylesterase [Geothrix oryzae]BDU69836.1 chemotaxis response regulator protein-glutamate methylesterase of group 1 operon [Geothrix oryzae]